MVIACCDLTVEIKGKKKQATFLQSTFDLIYALLTVTKFNTTGSCTEVIEGPSYTGV